MNNPNNDGLFKQVLQAQETQREGWMAEIPTIAPTPITDELLAGREHGNAIEFLACDLERELAAKDAEIDRLKKEIERYSGNCKAMDGIIGELQAELAKALTSQRQ